MYCLETDTARLARLTTQHRVLGLLNCCVTMQHAAVHIFQECEITPGDVKALTSSWLTHSASEC